ncbi:MAG: MFS transporter, partial [Acidimicrobiia bacterium]|nr:MFS transporter [Acidimicrobiia bacterium]
NVADPSGIDLFLISSVLISLALVPTSLSASSTPPPVTSATMSLRDLASIVPTGIVVSVLVGMANGALLGMGAVYATQAGMTAGQVSLFMGAPMVGGVLGQFPVGHLADRIPRRTMMIALGLIASVAAAALLVIEPASFAGYTMMFIIGACTFPLYSLAIAYTNDWLQPEQMLGASAALVTTNGVGAVVGPFLATFLMKAFGSTQYFVALLVTHGAVSVYVTYRVLTLSGARIPRPRDFGPFPARASAVAVYLLPRRKVDRPSTGITPDRRPVESVLDSARKP